MSHAALDDAALFQDFNDWICESSVLLLDLSYLQWNVKPANKP